MATTQAQLVDLKLEVVVVGISDADLLAFLKAQTTFAIANPQKDKANNEKKSCNSVKGGLRRSYLPRGWV